MYRDGDLIATDWFSGVDEVEGYLPAQVAVYQADIDIECDVDVWLQAPFYESWSDSGDVTIPGRVPDDIVNLQALEEFYLNDIGDYDRYRQYRVMDQYGWAYDFGTTLTEGWEMETLNQCNITVSANPNPVPVNTNGDFVDHYFAHGIPMCEVQESCISEATQTYFVDGKEFSHGSAWSCVNVQIYR
jgi:hypothetical protein